MNSVDAAPCVPCDSELSAAAATLRRVAAAGPAFFASPACRELRKSLEPILSLARAQQFGGRDPAAFREAAQLRAEALARRRRDAAHDAAHVNSTRLRVARIARLAEIVALGEGVGVDVPRVLDGPAGVDLPRVLDGPASLACPQLADKSVLPPAVAPPVFLSSPRFCYVCKARFLTLHHFYDALCNRCATLNWDRRRATADARGRVFIVTGARVKIGFQVALALLRAGARVLATSRFPVDLARRFAGEADAAEWAARIVPVGLDFRDVGATEAFAKHIVATERRLDGLINNACQTVRRPAAYYATIVSQEAEEASLTDIARLMLRGGASWGGAGEGSAVIATAGYSSGSIIAPSAAVALAPLLNSDTMEETTSFPIGAIDAAASQLDLRSTNSWLLRLGEVETGEAAEVLLINALAPFVLSGRLRALLGSRAAGHLPPGWLSQRGPQPLTVAEAIAAEDGDPASPPNHVPRVTGNVLGELSPAVSTDIAGWIINVSAVEGKFARESKQPTHPHTNMAKAALNMMTRTSARDYARDGIFMNSVDTGWINDENPVPRAARIAHEHAWATPLDEIDAAARILDPIFSALREAAQCDGKARFLFGAFLKDYHASEW